MSYYFCVFIVSVFDPVFNQFKDPLRRTQYLLSEGTPISVFLDSITGAIRHSNSSILTLCDCSTAMLMK